MKYLTLSVFVLVSVCVSTAGVSTVAQDKSAIPESSEKKEAESQPAADSTSDDTSASKTDELAESQAEQPEPGFFGKTIGGILNSGPIKMIRDGGWFMPPILLLGILAAGVIIERYRSLRMLGTDTVALRSKVQELLQADRVEEALEYCDREDGSVPAILSCGLKKFYVLSRLNYDPAKIDEQVVKSMDDYSVHIVAQLEKHLPILATISSVAPMLGFLGTVSGMIVSFQDIVARMGEVNIVIAAADGISEALLTTCFGLIVGIPAFIAYNYFTSLINTFVLEVEESATELIDNVTMQMALAGTGFESSVEK